MPAARLRQAVAESCPESESLPFLSGRLRGSRTAWARPTNRWWTCAKRRGWLDIRMSYCRQGIPGAIPAARLRRGGGRQGPTGIRRRAADPIQPALFNAYAARVHGETTGKRKGRVCTMLTRRGPPALHIIADTGKEGGKAAGKAAGPAAWKNKRPGADAMVCGKGRNPGEGSGRRPAMPEP